MSIETSSYLAPFFHLLRAANHFDIPWEYNEVNPRNPRSSARLRLDRVSSRRLIAEGCQRKRESSLLENVTSSSFCGRLILSLSLSFLESVPLIKGNWRQSNRDFAQFSLLSIHSLFIPTSRLLFVPKGIFNWMEKAERMQRGGNILRPRGYFFETRKSLSSSFCNERIVMIRFKYPISLKLWSFSRRIERGQVFSIDLFSAPVDPFHNSLNLRVSKCLRERNERTFFRWYIVKNER